MAVRGIRQTNSISHTSPDDRNRSRKKRKKETLNVKGLSSRNISLTLLIDSNRMKDSSVEFLKGLRRSFTFLACTLSGPWERKALTDFHYKNINEFISSMKCFSFHHLRLKLVIVSEGGSFELQVDNFCKVETFFQECVNDWWSGLLHRRLSSAFHFRDPLLFYVENKFSFFRVFPGFYLFFSIFSAKERSTSCTRASDERVSIDSVEHFQ